MTDKDTMRLVKLVIKVGSGLGRRLDSLGTGLERCTWTMAGYRPSWTMSAIPFTTPWQAREAAAANGSSCYTAGMSGSGNSVSPQPSGFKTPQLMAGAHDLGWAVGWPHLSSSLTHSYPLDSVQ